MASIFAALGRSFRFQLEVNDWTDELKNEMSGGISDESLQNASRFIGQAVRAPQYTDQMVKEMQRLVEDCNNLGTRFLDVQRLVEKAALSSKDKAQELREVPQLLKL